MRNSIQETRLSSGLTILTEKMAGVRSASLGFFFRIGSRDESPQVSGICHFIEHCLFKGSKKRNAFEIAIEMDRLGGNFDAFTSHEETAFTMKVVDKQLTQAFGLFADMLADPAFEEAELKREQQVIIEEIKMVEDTPEELLSEIFAGEIFPGHPLGRSIAGTPETVKSFGHKPTSDFYRSSFHPGNLIISAAGNIEHQQIVDLANQYFRSGKSIDWLSKAPALPPRIAAPIFLKEKKGLEQNHLLVALPFIPAGSEKRYAASLLANIIGGGTSSRLWQKVREQHGLAYSVGASGIPFRDCGLFQVYAATSPENFEKTIDLCIAEIRKVKKEGVSGEELRLAKEQAEASILLGLEDSGIRAGNLASSELTHGRQISVGETIARLEEVSVDDIKAIAGEFFKTENIALGGLGSFGGLKIERGRLEV